MSSNTPWTPVTVLILVTLLLGGWLLWPRLSLSRSHARSVPRASVSLSSEARAQLQPRMRRHAQAMAAITDAVMAFDDERVIRAATSVLDDPQLARPLSAEAESLATELPPRFHDFEASLRRRTEALVAAAQAHDGERLTAADAELAWTCAQCHAAFAGP